MPDRKEEENSLPKTDTAVCFMWLQAVNTVTMRQNVQKIEEKYSGKQDETVRGGRSDRRKWVI